jgi:serine/threonine protein kinase
MAVRIVIQVLNGMKALRAKCNNLFKQEFCLEIIHRDIKPANILISKGIYKLADYGFALSEIAPINKAIFQNFSVGTPNYMAPETILYNIYNEKTDIWALGIVFYEMLYGINKYFYPLGF